MRNFLDSVLTFIDLETLTDEEFELVEESLEEVDEDYNLETYKALDEVLQFREETLATRERLKDVYSAKGVDVSPSPTVVPKSNIYIGSALE